MKYIIDIDALKDCLDLLTKSWSDDGVYGYVRLSDVNAMIDKFPKEKNNTQSYNQDVDNSKEENIKHGRWVYWDGWCGNHDKRIDDATCSECGYKHPTVRYEKDDYHNFVPNKLADECPVCGAIMEKE